MYHRCIIWLNMRTTSMSPMRCLMIQTFGNSRFSGRTWYLCECLMIDLRLRMKLIEISSNDILSYRKEEVSVSSMRGVIFS